MRAIAQHGEAFDSDIYADRACGRRQGYVDFALRLDAGKALLAGPADRDVAHLAEHGPTVAVAYVAELRPKQAAVTALELDLFRVREPEAVPAALALETRKICRFSPKVE